jgi:hypothetical protein
LEASPTHPGTEINVTPLKEAPIMPNETIYQGDFRSPRKKLELSAFFDVKNEIATKTMK